MDTVLTYEDLKRHLTPPDENHILRKKNIIGRCRISSGMLVDALRVTSKYKGSINNIRSVVIYSTQENLDSGSIDMDMSDLISLRDYLTEIIDSNKDDN